MNLPRGTLKHNEECVNTRPISYLSRIDSHFSGVIRFFERGKKWDTFFLLLEDGFLIGYYATKGDDSLEKRLRATIRRFEAEVRTLASTEMKIARSLNAEFLLPEPVRISEIIREEPTQDSRVQVLFEDASFRTEINEVKQFGEDFHRRRMAQVQPNMG